MADVTLTDQQKVALTVTALNADGSPFDGAEAFAWTASGDGGSFTDGGANPAEFVSAGPFPEGEIHSSDVTVTDSYGLSGTITIDVTGTLIVPPPGPASLGIVAGEPEPK